MDRVMTNEKREKIRAANDPYVPVVHRHHEAVKAKKPLENIKIKSLSLEENDDVGGDPYNRTGSFCVPKFEDE